MLPNLFPLAKSKHVDLLFKLNLLLLLVTDIIIKSFLFGYIIFYFLKQDYINYNAPIYKLLCNFLLEIILDGVKYYGFKIRF